MAWHPSIDPIVSREEMLRVSSVLAVVIVVCDLASAPSVRMALWIASALAGCSLAILGIGQRFGRFAESLHGMRGDEGTPFATFNYHGNAGSYLNLILPALFGLAYVVWQKEKSKWLRAVLALAFLLVLAGVVINVSRGAIAIAALMLSAMGVWTLRESTRSRAPFSWRGTLMAGTLASALVAAVSHFANGGTSLQRWEQMVKKPTGEVARLMIWQITSPMAVDAGPFGNGPGTFKMLLPKSPRLGPEFYEKWILQEHEPGGRISMWSQAHQDYLQTIVEWGWLGAAMWGIVLLGGLARMMRSGKNDHGPNATTERTMRFCAGLGIITVCLNAAFDFPFQIFPVQLQLAMWLGLAWCAPEWEHSSPEASSPAATTLGGAGVPQNETGNPRNGDGEARRFAILDPAMVDTGMVVPQPADSSPPKS